MNEQELKQIWRTEEAIPLKNIDMQYIQQYTDDTDGILRRLTRKELLYGLIFSALFVFDFIYSGNFYAVLLATAIFWAYQLWKNRRAEKLDDLHRTGDVKNFLIKKEENLKRQINRQRVFSVVSIGVFVPLANLLNGSFYERMANPLMYFAALTITFVVVQIFIEFYNRRNYQPILEDLRYLIEQFDEDPNAR